MNYILAKIFNNAEYAKGFLSGKIYMNLLSTFGIGNLLVPKEDMNNKYRGDLNEGLARQIPVHNGNLRNTLPFFHGQECLPDDITTVGELDSRFLNENALSLFALYFDSERNSFVRPDPRMMDFCMNKDTGEVGPTVVITNPQEFLTRIVNTISRNMGSPFWLAYGLVSYTSSDRGSGERDEFRKSKEYEWQQEFRIAVDVGDSVFYTKTNEIEYDSNTGAIIIDVGDMSDIAMLVSTENFMKLDFPKEYHALFSREPAVICPFYPPAREKTTFACPVFKRGTAMYISQDALYPINRNPKSYRISESFISKCREMRSSKNPHFLNNADCYFSRLLDMSKANFDFTELSDLLSAIVNYMIMLEIRQMSDVTLKIEGNRIMPVYTGAVDGDPSLHFMKEIYREVQRKSYGPVNTLFAELVTISDDKIFEEYEYQGNRYVRIVANQDAVLSDGTHVKKGEAVWLGVSKIKWFAVTE